MESYKVLLFLAFVVAAAMAADVESSARSKKDTLLASPYAAYPYAYSAAVAPTVYSAAVPAVAPTVYSAAVPAVAPPVYSGVIPAAYSAYSAYPYSAYPYSAYYGGYPAVSYVR